VIIYLHTSTLRRTRWYDYGVRFVLGGLISAAAAVIARKFGPSVGGVFLAFPAIFPASATLIEKHERQSKEEKGLNGICRAREAVGLDAAGAAMGSIGLVAFAGFAWLGLHHYSSPVAIGGATVVWAAVSFLIWVGWKRNHWRRIAHAFQLGRSARPNR
jgi:Protein of unknown function (DUF3147)